MKLLVICAAIALLSLSAYTDARAKPDDDSFEWSDEKDDESAKPEVAAVAQAASNSSAPSAINPVAVAPSVPVQNATNQTEHHHHHHHSTPKVPQSINAMSSDLQSVNHVGFNQTCGTTEDTPQCDRTKNLVCSTMKKCICDPNENAIYIKSIGSCSKVSAATTSFACDYDEQCQTGTFGPYSKCDTNTGRCECVTSFNDKPIIRHMDKCYIQKRIGDYCENNDVCDASIEGKTDCIPNPVDPNNGTIIPGPVPVNNTRCNCAYDHVFLNTSNSAKDECLLKGTSESSECKADVQCQAGLGNYSRCFGRTCQCADIYQKAVVILYKGWCYKKLDINDVCESDVQCQAGISDDAVCVLHESYLPNEKTCQCPEGKICEQRSGNAARGFLASITLILLGATATKVLQ